MRKVWSYNMYDFMLSIYVAWLFMPLLEACSIWALHAYKLSSKQFEKLKRTEDINVEGIGKGLLICKHQIEANKGSIEIHSDGPDLGTIVRFSMPM